MKIIKKITMQKLILLGLFLSCSEMQNVLAFCEGMAAAYAASDFCVARSGASSLTELSHVGLPALLVPFPFAADDHQTANARVFEKAGAAILTHEKDLKAKTITDILSKLDDGICFVHFLTWPRHWRSKSKLLLRFCHL